MDAFRNTSLPISQRIEDLLSRLTPEEKAGEPLTVEVDWANSGKRAGEDVVQIYVHALPPFHPRPAETARRREAYLAPAI